MYSRFRTSISTENVPGKTLNSLIRVGLATGPGSRFSQIGSKSESSSWRAHFSGSVTAR